MNRVLLHICFGPMWFLGQVFILAPHTLNIRVVLSIMHMECNWQLCFMKQHSVHCIEMPPHRPESRRR